jgi:hypothetical protein
LAGQSANAVEVLRTHIELDPFGFPLPHLYVGIASYTLEQYAEAPTAAAPVRGPHNGSGTMRCICFFGGDSCAIGPVHTSEGRDRRGAAHISGLHN